MRAGEHNRDCDVTVWDRGSTHEHVWNHDFLRQCCANMLEGVQDLDDRHAIIVNVRTMDAFGYGRDLEFSQQERDAFAAILLANEPQRAYDYADTCKRQKYLAEQAAAGRPRLP